MANPLWYEEHAQRSNAIGTIIQAKDTGRILLGCRSIYSDQPTTWCNFGGGIEENETPHEALRRELNEEINTDIDVSDATPLAVFKSPSRNFTFFTLHKEVPEEFAPEINDEHCGWCWADPRCLPKPLHPGFSDTLNHPSVKKFLSL